MDGSNNMRSRSFNALLDLLQASNTAHTAIEVTAEAISKRPAITTTQQQSPPTRQYPNDDHRQGVTWPRDTPELVHGASMPPKSIDAALLLPHHQEGVDSPSPSLLFPPAAAPGNNNNRPMELLLHLQQPKMEAPRSSSDRPRRVVKKVDKALVYAKVQRGVANGRRLTAKKTDGNNAASSYVAATGTLDSSKNIDSIVSGINSPSRGLLGQNVSNTSSTDDNADQSYLEAYNHQQGLYGAERTAIKTSNAVEGSEGGYIRVSSKEFTPKKKKRKRKNKRGHDDDTERPLFTLVPFDLFKNPTLMMAALHQVNTLIGSQ